ncbi:MAG: CHASE2 domain-containing protein, partial [Candidatus Magnetominusculus sp. LBB02]|nr:CHASE2 domain-containing protein [Candidatus Magnetominusculus sp. LBB02]
MRKLTLSALQRYVPVVGIALVLISALTFLTYIGAFERMEYKILDLKFKARPKIKINPNIVTIDIDDQSIEETGRWPWPWRIHGDIVNFLTKSGVTGVVFVNMDFSQDNSNDIARGSVEGVKSGIINAYGSKDINAAIPDYETYFADSLKKNGSAYVEVDFKIPENDKASVVSGVDKGRLGLLAAKSAIKG